MLVAYHHVKNTKDRETDMDWPRRCSSLTLQCEEHLKYDRWVMILAVKGMRNILTV
jgi:hypothetical protein